ncbi:MAG: argininosuccinate synthase [Lentisphaeria bacterium]|nr:argininosuccinate synthase [Lentisphaeria bacterium]
MKVVVAYSGGLDTSVIVKWVKETYNAEVICYCAAGAMCCSSPGCAEAMRLNFFH